MPEGGLCNAAGFGGRDGKCRDTADAELANVALSVFLSGNDASQGLLGVVSSLKSIRSSSGDKDILSSLVDLRDSPDFPLQSPAPSIFSGL